LARPTPTQWISGALLGLSVIALIVVMANVWPLGADWLYIYHPVADKWVHGRTELYDQTARGYYNAPWAVLFLAPLTLLSLKTGQAILNVASILGLVGSIHAYRQVRPVPTYAVVLALTSPHVFDLLIRGQIDGVLLVGAVLGWWAIRQQRPLGLALAFCLLAIKPLNVILVMLLFLSGIRRWSRRDWLKVFSLPALAMLVSVFIAGWDWPLRYVDFARANPLTDLRSITFWRSAPQLGLPTWPFAILGVFAVAAFLWQAWHLGVNDWTLNLSLATNLVFSFYANGYHYVLLIPSFLFVSTKSWVLTLIAYALTWTPLFRIHDDQIVYRDYAYPILLLILLWMFRHRLNGPDQLQYVLQPGQIVTQ
jgi:hypothetical protein